MIVPLRRELRRVVPSSGHSSYIGQNGYHQLVASIRILKSLLHVSTPRLYSTLSHVAAIDNDGPSLWQKTFYPYPQHLIEDCYKIDDRNTLISHSAVHFKATSLSRDEHPLGSCACAMVVGEWRLRREFAAVSRYVTFLYCTVSGYVP